MSLRMLIQGEEGGDHTAFLGADTVFNVTFTDQDGNPAPLDTGKYGLVQLFSSADRASAKMREFILSPKSGGLDVAGMGTFSLNDTEVILTARTTLYAYGMWVDDTDNVNAGKVSGGLVSAAGANYTAAPTLTVDDTGTGGSGAVLTAVIKGTVLSGSGVISNPGSGYTTATVSFNTPPGGIAATGTVTISGGQITALNILTYGQGYTSTNPPVPTISGDGSNATATVKMTGTLFSVTVGNAGSGYKIPPTVTVTPAAGDTTGSGGAVTLTLARGVVKISETPSSITLK